MPRRLLHIESWTAFRPHSTSPRRVRRFGRTAKSRSTSMMIARRPFLARARGWATYHRPPRGGPAPPPNRQRIARLARSRRIAQYGHPARPLEYCSDIDLCGMSVNRASAARSSSRQLKRSRRSAPRRKQGLDFALEVDGGMTRRRPGGGRRRRPGAGRWPAASAAGGRICGNIARCEEDERQYAAERDIVRNLRRLAILPNVGSRRKPLSGRGAARPCCPGDRKRGSLARRAIHSRSETRSLKDITSPRSA